DLLVVVAAHRLGDDVGEPLEQDADQAGDADEEGGLAPGGLVQPAGEADHGDEQRHGGEQRPAASVRHVVDVRIVRGVGGGAGVGHGWSSVCVGQDAPSASVCDSFLKKVYESVSVWMLSGRSGSTMKRTGMSRDSPGCSTCAVKQKHSDLLK